jgi:hypothetical protein
VEGSGTAFAPVTISNNTSASRGMVNPWRFTKMWLLSELTLAAENPARFVAALSVTLDIREFGKSVSSMQLNEADWKN